MADADRIAAALRYQQELEAAQRPATMNPNIAAQGAAGRSFMAPPESVMDERYPAWKKSQNDAETLMMATDLVGSAIPLAGPAVKGAAALGRFAGPELAQGLENYMVRSGGILPMDTWHGSPHRFPPTAKNPLGEFDPMKIGTGEGNQAYGVGAGYLAENPTVAREYAKKLSEPVTTFGGKQISEITNPESKRLAEWIQSNVGVMQFDARHGEANRLFNRLMPEQQAALGKPSVSDAGQLYKVDLPDEQIAKMLDWDKPLSQQSKEVQDALARATSDNARMGKEFPKWGSVVPANYETRKVAGTTIIIDPKTGLVAHPMASSTTGGEVEALRQTGDQGKVFYENLLKTHGGAEGASNYLRSIGIPGIRYLDQGSRAGGGTSNFVVFDPKHMNIIGRE